MTENNRDNYFDIRKTLDCFCSALHEEDDINLGYYLDAYKELSRFCDLLGSVFSFVATEIHSKSAVMHELRMNCQESHFETLKTMIEYEQGNQLLNNSTYVSGCRTLLRLHRGLDFIRTFLRRVTDLNLEESTHNVATNAYYETLGKYHPWWIRQPAYIAMKILPNKRKLLVKVCGSQFDTVKESLPLMLEAADVVYMRTEELYKTHNLLNLP